MPRRWSILLGCALIFGCKSEQNIEAHIAEIQIDTRHSGEPNLFYSSDDKLYLSWIEYVNDSTDILQFSQLESGKWTAPKEIARGNDWFVNWADFPSIIHVQNEIMSAHWLQKSATGTYDYDVRIAQSHDGGNTWKPSIIPHRDGVNAEHGFVSMLPTPDGKTFSVWLDGRNTKNETNNAMTLRSAEIDSAGYLTEEIELDNRVCDCCQTGATWTDKGPIVVYRDRSEDEIRDIGIVRKVDGKWTAPKTLFEDKWMIAGCPVNGPSIDSKGSEVAVAWFTMSEEIPKVYLTMSHDYGAVFGAPLRIDEGAAIGRVDVAFVNNAVYIIWMENEDDHSNIVMKKLDKNGNLSEMKVLGTNSPKRSSGFPRMSRYKDGLMVAWTDARERLSVVRSFSMNK